MNITDRHDIIFYPFISNVYFNMTFMLLLATSHRPFTPIIIKPIGVFSIDTIDFSNLSSFLPSSCSFDVVQFKSFLCLERMRLQLVAIMLTRWLPVVKCETFDSEDLENNFSSILLLTCLGGFVSAFYLILCELMHTSCIF